MLALRMNIYPPACSAPGRLPNGTGRVGGHAARRAGFDVRDRQSAGEVYLEYIWVAWVWGLFGLG